MYFTQRRIVFLSAISYLLVIALAACNNAENKAETASPTANELVFDKLVGTWQNEDGSGFERWTKKEDGSFQYVAFSVKEKDTAWNENARVYTENDKWVFENTVKGQNEGKSVKFISSLLNDSGVQFSNPEHDFPTDINYAVVDANTVHAFIVGPNGKGGRDTIPFNYVRVK